MSTEPLAGSFSHEVDGYDFPLESHIMDMIVQAATACANRHAGSSCTTLGIESIRFLGKIEQGDIVTCSAVVYKVMGTSMEVHIKVTAEGLRDLERKPILSAAFIFAALDEEKNYKQLSPISHNSVPEKRCFREAEIRRIKRRKY